MADSIEELRAEIERLKADRFQMKAQIWALASFFGVLDQALGVAGEDRESIKALRTEFTEQLRDLFRSKPGDPEEEIQRSFRSSTFD